MRLRVSHLLLRSFHNYQPKKERERDREKKEGRRKQREGRRKKEEKSKEQREEEREKDEDILLSSKKSMNPLPSSSKALNFSAKSFNSGLLNITFIKSKNIYIYNYIYNIYNITI